MALIRLGPLVADIRGSIGGSTFARGYAGNYIRNRTKPVYPGSSKQSQRTALMSTLVGLWQGTLTDAQRVAWNDLAKATTLRNALGMDYHPSGFNLYARGNFMLSLTGQTLITTAPAAMVTPAAAFTFDYLEGTGCRVTNIGEFDTAQSGVMLMQRSLNKPQSRYFFKGPWDTCTPADFSAFDALPVTLFAEALCDQGKRNWVRFVVVLDDGATSAETVYFADRAAA